MRLTFILPLLMVIGSFAQDSSSRSYTSSKYFVGTSAFGMKAGEFYYTNFNLITQFVAYAPLDGLCIKAGLNPASITLDQPIGAAEITYSHSILDNLSASIGGVYTNHYWGNQTIGGSFKFTIGKPRNHLSLGISVGQAQNVRWVDESAIPALFLGANFQLNERNDFTIEAHSFRYHENFFWRRLGEGEPIENYFIMLGFRHHGKRNEVAYGITSFIRYEEIITLPFVALTFDIR